MKGTWTSIDRSRRPFSSSGEHVPRTPEHDKWETTRQGKRENITKSSFAVPAFETNALGVIVVIVVFVVLSSPRASTQTYRPLPREISTESDTEHTCPTTRTPLLRNIPLWFGKVRLIGHGPKLLSGAWPRQAAPPVTQETKSPTGYRNIDSTAGPRTKEKNIRFPVPPEGTNPEKLG